MDSTFNDQYAPDIEGLVLGVDTNLICIQTKQGKMMRVVADDIRNVELLQTSEWWAA